MAARNDPDAVDCGAAVDLAHEVKAVNIWIKIFAVPMGVAVLMPRHRSAESCVFYKYTFMERCEVVAMNRLGHF